ncbi:MAG: hypothetical protein LBS54_03805 [Dysgonamonadaceae bacterium]|jgi:hypothetical protein|nr:hypothetical protein [Dysgonamonadaceae bacterium]
MNFNGIKGFIRLLANDCCEVLVFVFEWLYYKRREWRMSLAIRLADTKQRAFNKRYHVMIFAPDGSKEKLISVNKAQIDYLKRKNLLPRKMGMIELSNSIFYSTPLTRNNRSTEHERTAAKEKYLRYCRRDLINNAKS